MLPLSLMKNISQPIYGMKTCRAVLKPICLIYLLRVCCFRTGVCKKVLQTDFTCVPPRATIIKSKSDHPGSYVWRFGIKM